jgi:hypothetical protein
MSLVRQNLRNKFSTFLVFDGSTIPRWSSPDPRLRRSIDQLLASEDFCDVNLENVEVVVLHLIRVVSSQNSQTSQISRWHLIAYLHETCFFVCQKLCNRYRNNELLAESFQVASRVICQEGFFSRYDPSRVKLITYVNKALEYKLSDYLSIATGNTNARSEWGKLYYLSTVELRENLVSIGCSRENDDYVNIHRLYKHICQPSEPRKKRVAPSAIELQAICDRFNETFDKASRIKPEDVLNMLNHCLQSIRERQNFAIPISLHNSVGGEEDSTLLIDTIEYDNKSNILENDDDSYFGSIREGLVQIVAQELDSLDRDKQGKLAFLRGFDCTTTEVANLYNVNQSTISRLYNPIINACLNYSKTFVSDFTDDTLLIKALRDWLKQYLESVYTNLLYEVVDTIVMSQLHEAEISFLNDLRKTWGNEKLVQNLNQSTEYINEERQRLKDVITGFVVNHLKTNFDILAPIYPVAPKIDAFIDKWMSDRPNN